MEEASKSGLRSMLSRNHQNSPTDASWPWKPRHRPFFTATHRRNPMLVWADEGGRATIHNTRWARCFRAVSYELATSFELACCMHDVAAAYS